MYKIKIENRPTGIFGHVLRTRIINIYIHELYILWRVKIFFRIVGETADRERVFSNRSIVVIKVVIRPPSDFTPPLSSHNGFR